jgi:phosphate acetyltransferase
LIIDKYKRLEEQFDFVLVEGTSFSGEGRTRYECSDKNLGIPTIIVGSGVGKH